MNIKNRSTENTVSQGQFRIQHVEIICKCSDKLCNLNYLVSKLATVNDFRKKKEKNLSNNNIS